MLPACREGRWACQETDTPSRGSRAFRVDVALGLAFIVLIQVVMARHEESHIPAGAGDAAREAASAGAQLPCPQPIGSPSCLPGFWSAPSPSQAPWEAPPELEDKFLLSLLTPVEDHCNWGSDVTGL